jgi:hypothetical protein
MIRYRKTITLLVIFLILALFLLLNLRNGFKDGKLSYKCEEGKTAYDLLLSNSYAVKSQDSSMGKFVTSINNKPQGGGKYWLYKINGEEATVGATNYKCVGKEDILWELR